MPSVKIITYPDKCLLQPSTDATLEQGIKIAGMLREAIANVTWGKPSGMAAPQIGINKRVLVVMGDTYINPSVTPLKKGGIRFLNEGCYSLTANKYDYPVRRAHAVNVKWTDEAGEQHSRNFSGFKGQVLQHEYDHLLGKLANGAKPDK